MKTMLLLSCVVVGLSLPAYAENYPVTGNWTYSDPDGPGAAKACPAERRMTFQADRRLDTGTSAPDYRNVSLQRVNSDSYKVVDEFFTGQIRGKISYTLDVADPDHLSIHMDASGAEFKLRRCEEQP